MLLTNCEAQGATPAPAAVQDFTPGVIVSTVVATINASRESISISNIGTADGTVNGARLPVGATVSFKAYLDPVTNTYNRVGSISISYDPLSTAGGGAFDADANTQITPATPIVLDQATGDEAALTLDYTTNKATSGDDTGLLIDFTDTDSPGTSYPFKIDVNGTTKLQLDYTGGNYLSNAGSFGASYLELFKGPAGGVGRVGANRNIILAPTTGDGVHLGSQTVLSWSSGIPTFVSGEIKIGRDAANTIYQRNGFNPQTFNIYPYRLERYG
jgi:hypothetical protein